MPIEFPYDREKATHAVRWLLDRHGGKLDCMQLLKLIFFADRDHLARFGRPIVGGHYVAMKNGPVALELYEELRSRRVDGTSVELYPAVRLVERGDEDYLSESDRLALKFADELYGMHDSYSLSDITHGLKVWTKNAPNEHRKSVPIEYDDFFLDLPEHADMLDVIREDAVDRAELEAFFSAR